MWNPEWWPRNGCDGRLKAKILITTISCRIVVKSREGNTNSPELSLLKFLPLAYHHSHFLAANLDFIVQQHSWGAHTFLQRAVLD